MAHRHKIKTKNDKHDAPPVSMLLVAAALLLIEDHIANAHTLYKEACCIEQNNWIRETCCLLSSEIKLDPCWCPMQTILLCGTGRDYISYLSIDRRSFQSILRLFTPLYHDTYMDADGFIDLKRSNHLGSCGRKRLLSPSQALAVALSFLKTTLDCAYLYSLHGIRGTTYNRYLRFSLLLTLQVLQVHPDGRLAWPQSRAEVDALVDLVHSRFPNMGDV